MKRFRRGNTKVIVIVVMVVLFVLGLACCGILGMTALLLPAVQQARTAARKVQSQNNLKVITLALHNYHDTYGTFPPAIVRDEADQPLYSWRVLILPFLNESSLYQQFDLSEPWDSPGNLQLSQQIPPVLINPAMVDQIQPGLTSYVAIAGPKTVLNTQQPVAMKDIVAGTSNVIVVVDDTQNPVVWTEPVDISPQQFMQLNFDGGVFPTTAAAMSDGSVRQFEEADKPMVQGMLSIDGS